MFRSVLVSSLCLATFPAQATNLQFNGTVSATCSVALGVGGSLALSSDGKTLGSQEGLAAPGTVLILSIGSNTIDVAAPTLVAYPTGYDDTGQSLEVAYAGLSSLSLVSQAYTTNATSFAVGNIPLSTLSVQSRIVNPNGFAAGQYTTQTVVTCE